MGQCTAPFEGVGKGNSDAQGAFYVLVSLPPAGAVKWPEGSRVIEVACAVAVGRVVVLDSLDIPFSRDRDAVTPVFVRLAAP